MRQIIHSFKKINALVIGVAASLLIISCGSYQSSTYGNDGIYGSNNTQRRVGNNVASAPVQESYFAKKLEQYESDYADSDVFTDVENYSSQTYDDNQENYNGGSQYQGWGDNAQQNNQVYVNNGFNYGYNNYYPFWNRGFRNRFGYGYGGYGGGPFFNFYYGNPYYYGGYYNNYFWGNNFWYGNSFLSFGFFNRASFYNNRRQLIGASSRRNARFVNSNSRVARSSNRRVVSPRATNSNSRRTFSSRNSSASNSSARSARTSRGSSANSSVRSSRSSRSSNGNFSSRRSSSSNRSFSPRRSSSSRSSGSVRSSRSSSSRRR